MIDRNFLFCEPFAGAVEGRKGGGDSSPSSRWRRDPRQQIGMRLCVARNLLKYFNEISDPNGRQVGKRSGIEILSQPTIKTHHDDSDQIQHNSFPRHFRHGEIARTKDYRIGAVATGSIKAQLALSAAGSMRNLGSISFDKATAPRIGIIKIVLAVLLVSSVRKVIKKQIARIIPRTGSVPTSLSKDAA